MSWGTGVDRGALLEVLIVTHDHIVSQLDTGTAGGGSHPPTPSCVNPVGRSVPVVEEEAGDENTLMEEKKGKKKKT